GPLAAAGAEGRQRGAAAAAGPEGRERGSSAAAGPEGQRDPAPGEVTRRMPARPPSPAVSRQASAADGLSSASVFLFPPPHVPAKACPALDAGWRPVRRQQHAPVEQ